MEKWEQDLKKVTTEQHDLDDVWMSIEQELKKDQQKMRRRSLMKRTWMASIAALVLVIAAVLFFSQNTQAPEQAIDEQPEEQTNGNNGTTDEVEETDEEPSNEESSNDEPTTEERIAEINQTHPEEKNVPLEIEGTTEQIPMVRVIPGNFAYLLYADEVRYDISFDQTELDDTATFITARDQVGNGYPEVGLRIETVADKQPTQVASEQANILQQRFPDAELISDIVTDPLDAYTLHARAGNEPSSEVVTIYILKEQYENLTIVITQTVFLEAQEGHGARFHAMLKTFEVLE
ncbi:hypothetical protein [Paenisporosarcina cavernae]|uniref:Uncharacterized protein n=1 Tax=Paenisporosarcina cavernae TaxID=2320858 RepID=A0A385YV48_9BACL|nr:hypothetical protein [Paenisporosarcina cavernae]AYC30351.1 hypothetical protein D3873_11090 [Paenisporosarcina cavernae]